MRWHVAVRRGDQYLRERLKRSVPKADVSRDRTKTESRGSLVLMRTDGFGQRPSAAIASLTLAGAMAAALAGCTSTPRSPAPIVESSATSTAPVVQGTAPGVSTTPAPVAPLSVAPVAPVEPGFYRVKPGDTLYAISRTYKQKPDDLVKWNNLPESRQVNIGQVLRVAPPGGSASTSASSSKAAQPPLLPVPSKAAEQQPAATTKEEKAPATATASKGTFIWPAHGEIVRKFGANGNRGIDIAGKVGDPVKASAPGKVVYAGSGLRSYGRMIIVKHSNDYLTAYAYNEKLLVKEGDNVKQGATIADMGTAPSGSPSLHFEIRKAGAAVDPAPLLGAGG
jgi:lipoprotein NlpD